MNNAFSRLVLFAVLILALFGCGTKQEPAATTVADLILTNGSFVTLNPDHPNAEALAVKDQKIMALGTTEEMAKLTGPATRIMDLGGAVGVPGFIEGHGHLKSLGYAMMNLRLMDAKNWDEIVAKVAEAAAEAEPGQWILGRGWHQEKWDPMPDQTVEGYPLHHKVSAVSPDNPVILGHASGHGLFANAKAMELAGIDGDTADPPGGKIVRDDEGRAIGVFEETAMGLIRSAKAESDKNLDRDQVLALDKKAIDLAMADCLAKGVTSFHDAGSPFSDIDLYKTMAEQGQLDLRLWIMVNSDNEALKANLPNYKIKGLGNDHLTLGGIKRMVDGALGSRGAWLLEPYADLPGSTGQIVQPVETIAETARIAKEHGLQLCVHAIGDRGNREVLDIFEKTLAGEDARWRIEHAQHLHPEDIPRFAKLNVIASMQGVHCTSDAPFVAKRLGDQRAADGAYVWRKLVSSGAMVTNGTDAPVEDVAPLASYYAMVTRQLANGETFYPDQKLTGIEALKCYTLNNAYASFQEDQKGSLSIGKYADITILSKDITTINPDEIPNTEVLFTLVGGEIKYEKP